MLPPSSTPRQTHKTNLSVDFKAPDSPSPQDSGTPTGLRTPPDMVKGRIVQSLIDLARESADSSERIRLELAFKTDMLVRLPPSKFHSVDTVLFFFNRGCKGGNAPDMEELDKLADILMSDMTCMNIQEGMGHLNSTLDYVSAGVSDVKSLVVSGNGSQTEELERLRKEVANLNVLVTKTMDLCTIFSEDIKKQRIQYNSLSEELQNVRTNFTISEADSLAALAVKDAAHGTERQQMEDRILLAIRSKAEHAAKAVELEKQMKTVHKSIAELKKNVATLLREKDRAKEESDSFKARHTATEAKHKAMGKEIEGLVSVNKTQLATNKSLKRDIDELHSRNLSLLIALGVCCKSIFDTANLTFELSQMILPVKSPFVNSSTPFATTSASLQAM